MYNESQHSPSDIFRKPNLVADRRDVIEGVGDRGEAVAGVVGERGHVRQPVQDGLAHVTSFTYNSRNRLTSVTDALNHVTTIGYEIWLAKYIGGRMLTLIIHRSRYSPPFFRSYVILIDDE